MTIESSQSTAALSAALAKVQAELPKLDRDRTVEVQQKNGNTYSYSYVTLANLSDAILPLLAKHGLAFAALPGAGADGKMCLRYHLLHESGETLTGEFPISGEGGIQMVGGRITYARRYCLAALVGVAADEDDESRLGNDDRPSTGQRAARPSKAAAKPAAGRQAQRGQTRPPAPAAGQGPPLPGEDDPAPADAMVTNPQLTKLGAFFTEHAISDRAQRLRIVSALVGRELGSSKELTMAAASDLIETLEGLADSHGDHTGDALVSIAEETEQAAGAES